MAGRKSLKDELKMFERYSELTEPYFRVLRKHLNSNNVLNEKWAVEQLTKAFVKMVPQDIDMTTKGKALKPTVIKIVTPDGIDIPALTKTISSVAIPDGQDND